MGSLNPPVLFGVCGPGLFALDGSSKASLGAALVVFANFALTAPVVAACWASFAATLFITARLAGMPAGASA